MRTFCVALVKPAAFEWQQKEAGFTADVPGANPTEMPAEWASRKAKAAAAFFFGADDSREVWMQSQTFLQSC